MNTCSCPDLLRIHRGRQRADFHCFRHGLSWSLSAGVEDFEPIPRGRSAAWLEYFGQREAPTLGESGRR